MDSPDLSAFSKYIPGFDFLQNLARQAAGSVAPGMQSGVSAMPQLSHWVAPTYNVEELDKRIQELRAVHFWLDQNAKALNATIQALEVQKMTLATLQGMNLSLQDVAEAFKMPVQTADTPPPAPAAAPEPAPPAPQAEQPAPGDGAESKPPAVDPMQWWGALTQQFQTIANHAIQDVAGHAAKAAEQVAQAVDKAAAAPMADPPQAPARKRTASAAKTAPPKRAAAPKSPRGKSVPRTKG